jgi:multiple sugar transport system ATP-binding protein
MNFMDVDVVEKSGAKKEIWLQEKNVKEGSQGFTLRVVPEMNEALQAYVGQSAVLGVRPEDIYDRLFYTGGISDKSTVKAIVDVVEPMGAEKYLYLSTGKNTIVARVEPSNSAKPHQDIELVFNMEKIHIFDLGSGLTIV